MDELVKVIRKNGSELTQSSIYYDDPLDLLWRMNPEIGSLAYAHRGELLSNDLLPYVAHFRSLQSDEKIALLRAMTERAGIDADERKHNYGVNATERMNSLNVSSRGKIATITQEGLTRRQQIVAQNMLDLQKTKYEAKYRIVQANIGSQKYISDNELEAVRVEAEAIAGAIEFSTQMQRDAMLGASQMDMETRIKEAEFSYLSKLVEAERIREATLVKGRVEVIEAYLSAQGEILRASAIGEAMVAQAQANIDVASYKALAEFAKSGAKLLGERGCKRVKLKGSTPNGPISLEIYLE